MWEAFGNLTQPRADAEELDLEAPVEHAEYDGESQLAPAPDAAAAVPAAVPAEREGAGAGGSCYCYCPPDRTDGQCFDVASDDAAATTGDCSAYLPKGGAAGMCPGIGVVKECGAVGAEDCSAPNMTMTFGGQYTCDKQCLDCTLEQSCAAGGGSSAVARCSCHVTRFYWCSYNPKPCVESPYFPRPPK